MTHLLKSEIELQSQKSKYEYLESKVDSLSALLTSPNYLLDHKTDMNFHHVNNSNNNDNHNDDNNQNAIINLTEELNTEEMNLDLILNNLKDSTIHKSNNKTNSDEKTPTNYNFYSKTTPTDTIGTVSYNDIKHQQNDVKNNNIDNNMTGSNRRIDNLMTSSGTLMISDDMLSVVTRCLDPSLSHPSVTNSSMVSSEKRGDIRHVTPQLDHSKSFTGTSASGEYFIFYSIDYFD